MEASGFFSIQTGPVYLARFYCTVWYATTGLIHKDEQKTSNLENC